MHPVCDRTKFEPNEFDYIIIDEVHHAEAESYNRVLTHCKPKFLLGMTATPKPTDDADIFKLFDYNIAYEIRLHQALEENLLCSFHYFAIEDFCLNDDVSSKSKMSQDHLFFNSPLERGADSRGVAARDFNKLMSYNRVEHIIEKMNFYSFSGEKQSALMFVSNVEEAISIVKQLN